MTGIAQIKQSPRMALEGIYPGPVLAVFGSEAEISAAIERLQNVPSIGYMHGALHLYVEDRAPHVVADEFLSLAPQNRLEESFTASDAHWRILGHAAELGMIRGRGVPASYQQRRAA